MINGVLPFGSGISRIKVNKGKTINRNTLISNLLTKYCNEKPIPKLKAIASISNIPNPLKISLLTFIFLGIKYITFYLQYRYYDDSYLID